MPLPRDETYLTALIEKAIPMRTVFRLRPASDQQAISEADRELLYHKPAVSSLVSFDGRAIVREAA